MKTNVMLGLLDQKFSIFKKLIAEYRHFFDKKQGSFVGYKKTYEPFPNTMDEPSKRGVVKVITTVTEKLDWFKKVAKEYIDTKLSIEATNGSGRTKALLVIDEKTIAELSAQELLALKSMLENNEFTQMYENIPVKSDAEIWNKTSEEMYLDRDIYEQPLMEGINQSLTKTEYILEDPNISKLKNPSSYTPKIGIKNERTELGKWTSQKFSGEWSQKQKAELLERKSKLYSAVLEALKRANEVEVSKSQITGEWILDYLHKGKI